jgi:hypothetical protein
MGDSAESLLAYLGKCGLSVVLGDVPDTLLLRGPKEEKTPTVLAALKRLRPEIVRILAPGKPAAVPAKSAPVTAEIEANCQTCRELVCYPAASEGVFCRRTNCPHPRLGTVPEAESPSGYKPWSGGGST